jgi:hypothetical protein
MHHAFVSKFKYDHASSVLTYFCKIHGETKHQQKWLIPMGIEITGTIISTQGWQCLLETVEISSSFPSTDPLF